MDKLIDKLIVGGVILFVVLLIILATITLGPIFILIGAASYLLFRNLDEDTSAKLSILGLIFFSIAAIIVLIIKEMQRL